MQRTSLINRQLLLLVILSLTKVSVQDVSDSKVDSQEESPLADIAKEILKEKNLENIGGMVNNFIQSDGAKQILDGVLQNLVSNENAGQLVESIGSLLNSASEGQDAKDNKPGGAASPKKDSKDEVNPLEILSSLGSLVGAMQGAGGNADQGNPAALLQGLGTLLGGATNGGGGSNAGALLQGLRLLMGNALSDKDKQADGDESNAGALLQGLGSILGAAVGGNQGGEGGAGALLQGLGSLLAGGQDGKKGGLNPETIGNMINMFASSEGEQKKQVKPSKSKSPKKASSAKSKPRKNTNSKPKTDDTKGLDWVSLASSLLGGKEEEKDGLNMDLLFERFSGILQMAKLFAGPDMKQYLDPLDDIIYVYQAIIDNKTEINYEKLVPRILRIYKAYKEVSRNINSGSKSGGQDESFDISSIIDLASSFLNQANSGKGGSNFMDYLPMIISTISSLTGKEAQQRADGHSGHSWALPPVIERIHIYFDNFMNTEMGQQLHSYLEEQKTFKVFQDEKGNFDYNKFEELIENHSFRRHWIQQVANKLVDFFKLMSNQRTQNQYVDMGIMFANSFLQNSGFPTKALLDTKRPVESLTNFANFAAKKYLGADIDTKEYVEPTVLYIQDLLKMAKVSIQTGSQSKELTEKLTDTINMEMIEPVTRVNRAYRFAKSQPHCDRYVFCIINQEGTPSDQGSLPGLRKGLYKVSSLIAGWFLHSHTGTSFWDLYSIVTEDVNCRSYHNEACSSFHKEEVKATTEYVHSEL